MIFENSGDGSPEYSGGGGSLSGGFQGDWNCGTGVERT